jgi:hypothetical protein
MNFDELVILGAAVSAFVFAGGMMVRRPQTLPQWLFPAGMTLLGVEALFQLASSTAADSYRMMFWQRASFVPLSVLPAVWVAFSLTFARVNASQFLRRWAIFLVVFCLAPLAVLLWSWREVVGSEPWSDGIIPVSWAGKGVHA